MKKPSYVLVAVAVTTLALIAPGCGSSRSQTGPATGPESQSSTVDVLGTWQVPGQPVTRYALTFYPDNTYKMTYQGSAVDGTYSTGAGTVALTTNGGARVELKCAKGAEMMKDQLVEEGGATWSRI
jgi:hypothetical protein